MKVPIISHSNFRKVLQKNTSYVDHDSKLVAEKFVMEPIFFRLDCALKSHVHSSLQSTFVTLSGQQSTLEDLKNIFFNLDLAKMYMFCLL